jgi:hypothetical protein
MDAYELLSKVAKIHLNEMMDPNCVVVASIERKCVPAKKKQERLTRPIVWEFCCGITVAEETKKIGS